MMCIENLVFCYELLYYIDIFGRRDHFTERRFLTMAKRLRADSYFTPQRDFYCLTSRFDQIASPSWHCHEFFEVEIITAGTSRDTINGVPYILNRGDFIFLQPDNVHGIQAHDDTGAELVNLAISASLMQEILFFLEVDDAMLFHWPLVGQLPQELVSQLTVQARQLVVPSKHTSKERTMVKQWITTCFLCCSFFQKPEKGKKAPAWLLQLLSEMKTPKAPTAIGDIGKHSTN